MIDVFLVIAMVIGRLNVLTNEKMMHALIAVSKVIGRRIVKNLVLLQILNTIKNIPNILLLKTIIFYTKTMTVIKVKNLITDFLKNILNLSQFAKSLIKEMFQL